MDGRTLIKDALKWAFGADRMSRYRRQVLDSTKRYALSAKALSVEGLRVEGRGGSMGLRFRDFEFVVQR